MTGYYKLRDDGKYADMPPCGTCKHKDELSVGPHCYGCTDAVDLALHKPNAETEFANYEEATANDRDKP